VTRRGLGRPPTTDPESIADAALTLLVERGYDNVTMEQIAQAANVSRSTLFRLFPTKSAALWGHRDEYVANYRRLLAERPSSESLGRNLIEAQRAFDRVNTSRRAIYRQRMLLVQENHGAATADLWSVHEDLCRCVVEHVRSRRPGLSSTAAETIGRMAWAGMWSAIVSWAVSGEESMTRFYDELLPYLERLDPG
jgi:AcrR family transcriptional regulator